MKRPCDALAISPLFKNLDHEKFGPFCTRLGIRMVYKGEVLFNEGDPCKSLGIVLEGKLSIQKYTSNGDFVTLDLLGDGDAFGESLIFGTENDWPYTVEAVTHAKVIMMTADVLMPLLQQSPDLISNFLTFLSDRVQSQNRRIAILSQRSLRQKIAGYLLDTYERQKQAAQIEQPESDWSKRLKDQLKQHCGINWAQHEKHLLSSQLNPYQKNLRPSREDKMVETWLRKKQNAKKKAMAYDVPTVELPVSKEVVSRLLAMPRPSFSRELVKMEKDGLIKMEGRLIQLLDMEALEMGVLDGMADDFDE